MYGKIGGGFFFKKITALMVSRIVMRQAIRGAG